MGTELFSFMAKGLKTVHLKKMMDMMPDDPDATINDCDIIQRVVIGYKVGEKIEYPDWIK